MVTAGEFCNRRVVIAHVSDSLFDVARRMRDEHIGALVVVDEVDGRRRPIGIVSDRDIVVEVLAVKPDSDVRTLTVADAMSPELIKAWEDDALLDVLKRMRAYGVRRIPVVDSDGVLAGLITFDDLVEQLADETHDLATLLSRERRHESKSRPSLSL